MKIGVVLYADKNDPYIALHVDGVNRLQSDLKLKDNRVFRMVNVLENDCYDSIAELVEKGCNLIFSVGKSFEDYMVQSAMENPDVQFCVADGEQAQTNQLNNLHSYSMKEFEARYVAGVAAGLKLKDMIQDNELSASDAIVGYTSEDALHRF